MSIILYVCMLLMQTVFEVTAVPNNAGGSNSNRMI